MQNRERWGSKLGFILAAAGSAVGIGNIWKYPHMAGQNGGAAFTLVYLLCILVVGLSIVIAEFAIGRKTQLSPVGAFEMLAPGSNWKWVEKEEIYKLPFPKANHKLFGALEESWCIC